MAFKCESFKRHDDKGNLTGSGVKWTEGDEEIGSDVFSIIVAMAIFLGGATLANNYENIWFFIIICIPSGAFAALMVWSLNKRKEELTFTTDDRARIGNGKHYTEFRPSNIVSIEYRRDEQPVGKDATPINYPRCHIIFMNNEGEISHVANRLHENNAIKVTTQLSKALDEIRRAMQATTNPTSAQPIQKAQPARSAAGNIDDIDPLA
ncbi:hypothetical protein [Pseudogemmobacter sonorensis]|uniref:hypothetical protein n=1 Tax=Pseudogemmobacter sonorensis TaxID=2989681 RepID=UPI00369A2270